MKIYKFIALVLLVACSNSPVSKDPSEITAPFNGKTFQNIEPTPGKSFWDIWKWRLGRWIGDVADWPEKIDNPQFKVRSIRVNEGVNIVVINHATILIQMNGLNILTDPIYSERCSPVSFAGPKRVVNPGIKWEDLPKIDYVLISHDHYDHLDLQTLKKLWERDKPTTLVGLGLSQLLNGEGISKVIEMDWWQSAQLAGVNITFVPAQHWSRRSLFDTNQTLWGGYVLEGDKRIYFAGDTGHGKFFKMIKNKLGAPDVTLIPIGAYEPRWFMKSHHINPEDAVKAFLDLETTSAIGIHFGTFDGLTDEAIDQPAKDLKKALDSHAVNQERFIVPIFGKSYRY